MTPSLGCKTLVNTLFPFLGFFLIIVLCSHYVEGVQYSLQFDYCYFFHGKCIKTCDLTKDIQFGSVNFLCNGGNRCCVPGIRHSRKSPKQFVAAAPSVSSKSDSNRKYSSLSTSSFSSPISSTQSSSSSTTPTNGKPHLPLDEDNNTNQNLTSSTAKEDQERTIESPNISGTYSFIHDKILSDNVPSCGVPGHSLNRRVVGGINAERCVFPWMVYIARDPDKDDVCGGTLVSDRHVITAAHCYDGLKGKWPSLIIGEYNKSEDKVSSKFSTTDYKLTVHPGYYKVSYRNDIAILTLATPIPLNDYECIRPICLPDINHALYVGKQCTVAGWGTTSRDLFKGVVHSTPSLMKTDIEIVHNSVCAKKFRHLFMPDSQICAGDLTGSTDSCVGDSGGPLMCTLDGDESKIHYIVGVVSSGAIPCARKGIPALYTDVRAARKWIDTIMKKTK